MRSRPLGRGGGVEFVPGMSASLDVAENPDEGTSARFPITNIIGIHETFDLALLRVEKRVNGLELPEPLKIGSAPPGTLEGHEIYVIGSPGAVRCRRTGVR
jgi:hypothetical protein